MSEKPKPKYNGYTIGIFLPKEASEEHIKRVMDAVEGVVHGDLLADRGGWDPAVVKHRGDVFQIDSGCGNETCPHPHIYLSTSCYHGVHSYCKNQTGLVGRKIPGVCKFCEAPCICECHRKEEIVDG